MPSLFPLPYASKYTIQVEYLAIEYKNRICERLNWSLTSTSIYITCIYKGAEILI